jgi:hypothetical protein
MKLTRQLFHHSITKISRLISLGYQVVSLLVITALGISGCMVPTALPSPVSNGLPVVPLETPAGPTATAAPTRPVYAPGELVDYLAQPGDTLSSLAVHFNTSVAEILAANSFIPADATTMPPGMPMRIPIYYAPFWGSQFKIIPDSLFVNGPAQVGFNIEEFVNTQPGWLRDFSAYASDEQRSGANLVNLAATNYSISPRLLLAILEYQTGALSQPQQPDNAEGYWLGFKDFRYRGLYLQLTAAANTLNNAYYGWRTGSLVTFDLMNQRTVRPDPWQNAASVALQYYYAGRFEPDQYALAISPDGLASVYTRLFGEPWTNEPPHLPGSLQQPALTLPFAPGRAWAYTGGPHTPWGSGEPIAAIDFAPGAEQSGCFKSEVPATAMADGVVARSEPGIVVLDLDNDGDERTGWAIFYLHVATEGRAVLGTHLSVGEALGFPSCEGGNATGTHIHIARKYNGEWILTAGPIPFNLEGWVARNGATPYEGELVRGGAVVKACECSDQASQLAAQALQGGEVP